MVVGKKILVTGSNGQLGLELQQVASSFPQFHFIFLSRKDLPIDDLEVLNNNFETHQPDYVINCAAYTAVDRAEEEKQEAFRINGEAAGQLAILCKQYQAKFIHISTDYVFDGTANKPYREDSPINPQSVYGASKAEGERLAFHFNPAAIVIRTSWVYSEFGKNFVKTMRRLLAEKDEINVVDDQVGSPTYAADLASVIVQIIAAKDWEPGIYHYSNEGIISWYDFAMAIKEITDSNCKVNPIPTSQYPTPAKRPAYSVLDNAKIQDKYNVQPLPWKQRLAVCLQRLS